MSVVMEEVTRHATLRELEHELGNTEQTAILLEALKDAWENIDELIGRFGLERAIELMLCESRERAKYAYFVQVDEE